MKRVISLPKKYESLLFKFLISKQYILSFFRRVFLAVHFWRNIFSLNVYEKKSIAAFIPAAYLPAAYLVSFLTQL